MKEQRSNTEKLKAQLKKAKKQIKQLEGMKEERLRALDKMPDIRSAVYLATFIGLTYAYKEGVIDFMPSFFFQFGQETKDPFGALTFDEKLIVETITEGIRRGGKTQDFLGAGETAIKKMTPKDMDAVYREQLKEIDKDIAEKRLELRNEAESPVYVFKKQRPDTPDTPIPKERTEAQLERMKALRGEIRALQAKRYEIYKAWGKYTAAAIVIAMGLAGATMLFLMETSTSEVMDIGAKALDAVTPLT